MFVVRDPINNIPTLVQTMAWHRPGNNPLSFYHHVSYEQIYDLWKIRQLHMAIYPFIWDHRLFSIYGWARSEPMRDVTFLMSSLIGLVLAQLYIEGILQKGPYPPCLCMADRALLAGYPRFRKQALILDDPTPADIWYISLHWHWFQKAYIGSWQRLPAGLVRSQMAHSHTIWRSQKMAINYLEHNNIMNMTIENILIIKTPQCITHNLLQTYYTKETRVMIMMLAVAEMYTRNSANTIRLFWRL